MNVWGSWGCNRGIKHVAKINLLDSKKIVQIKGVIQFFFVYIVVWIRKDHDVISIIVVFFIKIITPYKNSHWESFLLILKSIGITQIMLQLHPHEITQYILLIANK